MEKLKMQTANVVDENIKRIGELFPNCLTERLDENGRPEVAIDFDQLRQELSKDIVEGPEERYQFTWPDKRNAIRLANAPTTDTLRPCREESVDFDNTQNLYIEGDNLEVLKLLRENYLGKVKMIYIDPPYNTGNDFVYNDDFAQTTGEYIHNSGQEDEDGNRLVANTESNGRFHTDWLNMIYPRLKVAKDLLSEDGVIFIHIDDNEVDNLRKIANEVFGADNYINLITVKTKVGGVSGSSEGKSLKDTTEYILVYTRSKAKILFNPVFVKEKLFDRIKTYELQGKSWKYTSIVSELSGKTLLKEDKSQNMRYYGYKELLTESITTYATRNNMSVEDVYNQYADRIYQTTNAQSSVRQTVIKETTGYDYPMYGLEYEPMKGKNQGSTIEILYKGDQRRMMMYLSDAVEKIDGEYYYLDKLTTLWDDIDYNNLTKEGDIEFPNGKKPIKLIQRLLNLSTKGDSIVLDFFSGSASTAHAVMQLNAEDGGNRKFIMVQLPEVIDEKSEAYKAGYENICEIGKERIRRAGKKILEEQKAKQGDLFSGEQKKLDVGFRVLKLDSSNMQDVYYSPEEFNEKLLFEDNIKPDRTEEDLLFQAMIELGIELSAKIEKQEIAGKTVWNVAEGYLMACFDKEVNETAIKAIAKQHPYYFVLRDASLATDQVADNFEQIWEEYSKDTIRRII